MKKDLKSKKTGTFSSPCGHSSCGSSCRVKHVGLTSRISDHHMFHASRAITNIWAAAIVSGLAVVLTGAIAWSSVQATGALTLKGQNELETLRAENARLKGRTVVLEKQIQSFLTLSVTSATKSGDVASSTGSTTSTR